MKIYRISNSLVKQNKEFGSYNFTSINRLVDQVDLEECLLTELMKAEAQKEEIFSSSDLLMVEFEEDKKIVKETIIFDNREYEFYLASPSMLKKSCALFVRVDRKQLFKDFIKYATGDVDKRIEEANKKVVVNKIQAGKSLIGSGAERVNLKPNIVITEDATYKYKGLHTVLKDLDSLEFEEKNIETDLNAFDGQGFMSTKFANKVQLELNKKLKNPIREFNYMTFRTYITANKGMCIKVDLEKELDSVNKYYGDTEHLKYIDGELCVKDIFNEYHKVKDIDMLLNTSQTKFIKYFKSNNDIKQAIDEIPAKYKDAITDLYICLHSKNKLSTSELSYQFSQATSLTYQDYINITQKERRNIVSALDNRDILFMLCDLFEKDSEEYQDCYELALELVKYDKSFLKSKAVVDSIRKLLVSKINKTNYAKVKIDNFSYRLMVQDPNVALNFVATRDMNTARTEECLQAGEFYALNEDNNSKIVFGRNPLSSHQELRKCLNAKNEFIDSLGYTSKDMFILNCFDCMPTIMSGADFDGDSAGVIVNNDLMFDNVIELDSPLFFNTLDGETREDYYTEENIKELTILGSGNVIGNLAILNSGLQNNIKTFPYLDTRNNKYYSSFGMLKDAITKEVCSIEGIAINDICNYRDRYLDDLLNRKIIINTMDTMTQEEQKQYIINRHKTYKNLEFLILIAQQMAIDTSKTGYEVDRRLMNKINEIANRPYFICYTESNRKMGVYTNSPLDRFARDNNSYLSSMKSEVLNNIVIGDNVDKQFKDRNYCREIIMRASENKFNVDNVNYIVKSLEPKFKEYKNNRMSINYNVVTNIISKRDSMIHYDILDNKFQQGLFNMISYCSNENKEGLTIYDFMYSIYQLKFKDDAILRLMPSLIIQAIKEVAEEVEVIKEGKCEDAIRFFTYNNNVYSVVKQKLNIDKVSTNINKIALKMLNNGLQKQNKVLKLQVPATLILRENQKYTLVRNKVQEYLWDVYLNGQLICDNARVIENKKEYKATDTLEISVRELLNISKTGTYRNYSVY